MESGATLWDTRLAYPLEDQTERARRRDFRCSWNS